MKPTAALPALLAGAMLVSCSGLRPSDDRSAHAAIDTLAVPVDVYEETGRILDGVSYDHHVRAHHGPYVLVGVVVAARVPGTPEPAPLRLRGADPVELRLFPAGGHAERPVWTSRHSGVGECAYHRVERPPIATYPPAYWSPPPQPGDTLPPPIFRREVEPSHPQEWVDSASIRCGYPAHHILGDSLPPGRYSLGTLVHTRAGTLAFDGPEVFLVADTLPPVGDPESLASHLRYAARAWVTDSIEPYHPDAVPSLETVVGITNVGPRRLSLIHGSCPVRIRAFRLPERAGRPDWEGGTGCDDLARRLFLSPGETVPPSPRRRRRA